MANVQNLIPVTKRTPTEQKEISSKGGKASAIAKRNRKTLKEELLLLLENNDTQKNISSALILEALKGNNSGSVTKAFEVIRDTIGEKPKEQVDVDSNMNVIIRVDLIDE